MMSVKLDENTFDPFSDANVKMLEDAEYNKLKTQFPDADIKVKFNKENSSFNVTGLSPEQLKQDQ
jgi:cell fate regulator YaaT (PSP1 superfamily)